MLMQEILEEFQQLTPNTHSFVEGINHLLHQNHIAVWYANIEGVEYDAIFSQSP